MKKIIALLFMAFSVNSFAEGENTLKDVQFKDLNNNLVTLEQVTSKDKPVYVKMWASWCPICLAGLAEINELSAEPNKNFDVVTLVSPGAKGEKETKDFIEWYKGLEYKNIIVLLDENGETIKRAKVRGYPSSVLLDADLTIQKTVPGHLGTAQIKQLMGN
ncbi:redoxin family protein [Aggregatibacter kilianii]|uniref:redoxin family protein n=1 Tax=Aggregatibacter kilianii TaxID=2025884 RepID=UPI000D64A441|nr:redoxin family protein [Aggregatibacter kilianii]